MGDVHAMRAGPGRRGRGPWLAAAAVAGLVLAGGAVLLFMLAKREESRVIEDLRGKRAHALLAIIAAGLDSYRLNFGDYPPSEPDRVTWVDPNVKPFVPPPNGGGANSESQPWTSDLVGFCGAAALVVYLNGRDGKGYSLKESDADPALDPSPARLRNRVFPPLVEGVKVSQRLVDAPRGPGHGAAPAGFLDPWGNEIEYFRAHRGWGDTAARVFPRAVNAPPSGSGEGDGGYRFEFPSGVVVAGYDLRLPVTEWSDPSYSDYRRGWANHGIPVGAGSFLLVSAGPDGRFGTDDDIIYSKK